MNTENMLIVADLIEKHPTHFDMSQPWRVDIHTCGSVGCIAGYAEGLLPKDSYTLEQVGSLALDLTPEESWSLFYGDDVWVKYADELGLQNEFDGEIDYVDMDSIKPHHAVTMLRNLANGTWSF